MILNKYTPLKFYVENLFNTDKEVFIVLDTSGSFWYYLKPMNEIIASFLEALSYLEKFNVSFVLSMGGRATVTYIEVNETNLKSITPELISKYYEKVCNGGGDFIPPYVSGKAIKSIADVFFITDFSGAADLALGDLKNLLFSKHYNLIIIDPDDQDYLRNEIDPSKDNKQIYFYFD